MGSSGTKKLFKTVVINQIGPWKSMREVEWETLKWVDWYNNRRLFGPIGYIPRRSRGGVQCKPEHTRYGRLKNEQIILR